jgi:hypothetical protein
MALSLNAKERCRVLTPTAPGALPQAQMQRLASEQEPQQVQTEATADVVEPEDLAMEEGVLHLPVDLAQGARSDSFKAGADSLVSFADLQRALIEGREDVLKGYARRWLADADTTDAESRNRRQAEAIVDRAIEAMGGLQRMTKLKNKEVTPWFIDHQTGKWMATPPLYYKEGRKFREGTNEATMRGFDGYEAWGYRYGVPISVSERGLQQRAERWDFLAQFKGEGVRLSYMGWSSLPGGVQAHTVLVEDMKYGETLVAFFDPFSHLMSGTMRSGRREYISAYRRVEGVLTPYQFVGRRFETRYNLGYA